MSERLYATGDGTIVAEGHPDAAFLVVGDSGRIPAEFADAVAAFRDGKKHTPKHVRDGDAATPKRRVKKPATPKH